MRSLQLEQAVYGSFPFWQRGYALLGHSPGCSKEWLEEFQNLCQWFGEPRGSVDPAGAILSTRVEGNVWVIAGVFSQGSDSLGRPGALAFHGLFATAKEFRKAGFNPFELTHALKGHWKSGDTRLPALSIEVASIAGKGSPAPEITDAVPQVARALRRGHLVALESSVPITDLARMVWAELPPALRRKRSVATFAFSTSRRFDLVALPRVGTNDPPAFRIEPQKLGSLQAVLKTNDAAASRLPRLLSRRNAALGYLAASVALGGAISYRAWSLRERSVEQRAPSEKGGAGLPITRWDGGTSLAEIPPRDRPSGEMSVEQRQRVEAGLRDLAIRCGVSVPAGEEDIAGVLRSLHGRLRYRGPWLSDYELKALRAEPGSAPARAIQWHEHLRHFQELRDLPAGFEDGPLDWQIDVLGWSFQAQLPEDMGPEEKAFALADAIAVPGPIRPSLDLIRRYPAVDSYARFLEKLPRK